MRFRELERIVLDDGWFLNDVRGSHHQYKHPTKSGKVTIPNHRGDIPLRVVNSILKQAGLKYGESLPNPTTINAVKSDDPTAFINLICVNLDNYARAYDDRAVKKTLTIPAWLNTACENYGINYSKVLKDALIAKLQQVQM